MYSSVFLLFTNFSSSLLSLFIYVQQHQHGMSTVTARSSSSRGSVASEEVEVSGRGRGIRTIDLPAVFTTAEEQEMLAVITAFDLSRNELAELTSLQPLRSLLRFNASYNHVCRVAGLPLRLTQLNLSHNKLEHLDFVGELTHLRELDVSFNRLSSLAGLTSRVPLEVLTAEDNRIQRTTGLEGVQSLRVLSLSNNYISDIDELLFLPTTPALTLLSLTGNPVTRARHYRRVVGQLQPAVVTLDGAAVLREEEDRERRGSRNTSALANASDGDVSVRPQRPQQGERSAAERPRSAASRTDNTDRSSTAAEASRHPNAGVRAAYAASPTRAAEQRATRGVDTIKRHECHSAATQTVEESVPDASLDISGLAPRADVPRPAARTYTSSANTTTAAAATASANNATSSSSSALVRRTPSATQRKGRIQVSAAPLHRGVAQSPPQRATAAKTAPRGETSGGRLSASSVQQRSTAGRDDGAAGAQRREGEEGKDRSAATDIEMNNKEDYPGALMDSAPPSLPQAVQTEETNPHSSSPLEDDGRQAAHSSSSVGYASLHATPSTQRLSSGGANQVGSSSRLGRYGARTPATLQRSAASQEMDLTTAQLHDSLVAQEQLEKECQALRQRTRQVEAQLTDARRVVSQQLGELSQLRLERDALRQSETDLLERLEKERRAGKTRASHHGEEVQTLQAQYERMKTFYEAQLADTRRELSAERARLLQQRPKVSEAVTDMVDASHTATAAASAVQVSVSQSPPLSPPLAVTAIPPAASAKESTPPITQASPAAAMSDELTQQLASWLYTSLTAADSSDTSHASVRRPSGEQRETEAPRDVHPPSISTSARTVLERFVAQHTRQEGHTTEPIPAAEAAVVAAESDTDGGIATTQQQGKDAVEATKECTTQQEEDEKAAQHESASLPLPPPLLPQRRLPPPPPLTPAAPEEIKHSLPQVDAAEAGVVQREATPPFEEEEDEEEESSDEEETVLLAAPPAAAAVGPSATTSASVVPERADTRDARVRAAKAVLQGMEDLFGGAS